MARVRPRQYHLAATHDHIAVGERTRELERLLDQQDRKFAREIRE
jgi:hypothetical protein